MLSHAHLRASHGYVQATAQRKVGVRRLSLPLHWRLFGLQDAVERAQTASSATTDQLAKR